MLKNNDIHTRTYKQANVAKLTCFFFNKAPDWNVCPFRWNEEDTAGTQILFSILGDMFTLEVIEDIFWRPAERKPSRKHLRFMSLPNTFKDHERNVRYIKGGLLWIPPFLLSFCTGLKVDGAILITWQCYRWLSANFDMQLGQVMYGFVRAWSKQLSQGGFQLTSNLKTNRWISQGSEYILLMYWNTA